MIENQNSRGIKGDDQCPRDQADWVEEIHDLESHQTSGQGEDKDAVTEPSQGLVIKSLHPLFFPEENSIEEVDRRAHGAEPPAEEVSEEDHEKKDSKSWKHPQNDLFLSEDRDHGDEGIEPKIEVNRYLQFKRESGLNDEVEKETERKDLNRPSQVRDGSLHVALTFLTRTFERSI
jgi:hypothetical protein